MSLFPLPAIIFLCCLILLLVLLTVLYFTVLKKDLCFPIGGSGGAEEGEDALLENGKGTTDIPDGPAKIETQPTGDVTGEGGGGVEVPSGDATNGEARGSLQPATPGSDQVLTTPASEAMTNTQPAPSIVGATDSVSNVGDPVGFIEPEEPEPLSIAGKILIQFTYMPAANKVNLTVIRVGDMPPPDRGGSDNIQVHLCVLPMRKQRFRTKAVPVSKGVFNETFQFIHMTVDLVETCGIRLRVYGTQRFSKRLIGEVKVPLSQVDLTSPLSDEQIWKTLSPKGLVDEEAAPTFNLSELSSAASFGDITEKAELLVNLHYQDLTGRLTVEVIRAANLKPPQMLLLPDTFVKIKVISGTGKKIGKSKTLLRMNSSDPEFNVTFIYPMSPVDLKTATMMFSVYMVGKRRRKKKAILGWFAFGQNTSGTCETNHWKEMIENPDQDVCHWQALQTAG